MKHRLGVLALALLIRIPRIPNMQGADAYVVMWMAEAIRNGALFSSPTWLISPLSFFGFYPFSHYPIGIPTFLASLLWLGISMGHAILLLNFIETLVAWRGIDLLSRELFEHKDKQLLFIGAFLLSPYFLSMSYWTAVTRGAFLALLPFIMLYSIRYMRDPNLRWLSMLFLILTLETLIHRLWLGLLFYLLACLLSKILIRTRPNSAWIVLVTVLILSTLAFFIGISFFGIRSSKTNSPWFSNSDPLGLAINLVIDYLLNIGIIAIFLPFGIWALSRSFLLQEKDSSETNNRDLACYALPLALPIFALGVVGHYNVTLFLPIFLWISVIGFFWIFHFFSLITRYDEAIVSIGMCLLGILYGIAYSVFLTPVLIFLIPISLAFGLAMIAIIGGRSQSLYVKNKVKNLGRIKYTITISLLLVIGSFSLVTFDGRMSPYSNSDDPANAAFPTSEEVQLIRTIKNSTLSGFIFVYHHNLAVKMRGAGFLPVILTGRDPCWDLYYGLVSREEVYENTEVDFQGFLTSLKPFRYSPPSQIGKDTEIFSEIMQLDLEEKDDYEKLIFLRIQFIVTRRNGTGIEPWPYVTTAGTNAGPYPLLLSLPGTASLFDETIHLLLWRIY